VCGAHFYGVNDFDEVYAIAFGKKTPFVQESQNCCTVRVLNYFGGLRFYRSVQNGQWIVLCIKYLSKEFFDACTSFVVATSANAPEIAYARYIILSGHNSLKAVCENWLRIDIPWFKFLFKNWPGDELCCARCNGGLNEHEAWRLNHLSNHSHRCFKRRHFCLAGSHVAEVMFGVVALHINNYTVSQFQAVIVVCSREGFFVEHAPLDYFIHFRVLSFDRWLASIEKWNLPVTSRAGSLAANNKFPVLTLFIFGVSDDGCHHCPDKSYPHDNDDFFAIFACLVDQFLNASKLFWVLLLLWKWKLFSTCIRVVINVFVSHKMESPFFSKIGLHGSLRILVSLCMRIKGRSIHPSYSILIGFLMD